MKKNILGIQMSSEIGDREENYKKIKFLIDKSYKEFARPDIIVLPEVWTSGWDCSIFDEIKESDGKTEEFLSNIARDRNVNIIGGSYIKKTGDSARNTCVVFNRKGKKIAQYEKIHLYSPDGEADAVQPGRKPVIVNIEDVKIGLSICYDIRFPELFRSYISSSFPPELMINMSAWPKTRSAQYTSMAQSRAIENQCYFMALSQTGLIKNGVFNAGRSVAVNPMGEIIDKLYEEEDTIYFKLDTDEVEEVRNTYPNLSNRKVHNFGFIPDIMGVELNV